MRISSFIAVFLHFGFESAIALALALALGVARPGREGLPQVFFID